MREGERERKSLSLPVFFLLWLSFTDLGWQMLVAMGGRRQLGVKRDQYGACCRSSSSSSRRRSRRA